MKDQIVFRKLAAFFWCLCMIVAVVLIISPQKVRADNRPEEVDTDFYVYKPYCVDDKYEGGYAVSLSDKFRNAIDATYDEDSSFSGISPDGTELTWKKGDPLPDPDPNGIFNGLPVLSFNSLFWCMWSVQELDLSHFTTSNIRDMSEMFFECEKLTALDISNFTTSSVTEMWEMFEGCSSLTTLDMSGIDTSSVTNMWSMFEGCSSLTALDLSGFDTSSVTDMRSMFEGCSSLTALDLSGFDTSSVKNMSSMFDNCTNLKDLNLSGFDTSKCYDFYRMFFNCDSLKSLDLSSCVFQDYYTYSDMFYSTSSKVGSTVTGYVCGDDIAEKFNDSSVTSIDTSKLHFVAKRRFSDIKDTDYYRNAAIWAVVNGVTTGASATTFNPKGSCNRGQMVTFLWNYAGCPEPSSMISPFTDVTDTSKYYYKPVLWAVENGITNGTSKTTFSPNATVTRAQAVTLMWNSAGKPEPQYEGYWSDVAKNAYYYNAVQWAGSYNITSGTDWNSFSPNNECTRGQVVTFLYRMSQYND